MQLNARVTDLTRQVRSVEWTNDALVMRLKEDVEQLTKDMKEDNRNLLSSLRITLQRITGTVTEIQRQVSTTMAKAIKTKRARIAALDDLMSKAYEDKLLGKMPEELCLKFIDRYLAEQENLRKEVSMLEAELRNAKDMRENIDEFMSRIKKYLDVTVITREMMLELFDKIIIGEKEPPNGAPRLIQLLYEVDIDSVL